MLRGLYRFYLYTVFIAMLIFAATGLQRLLQIVLAQSIFSESSGTPTNADLVQAIVYAVVALITAALFGGLHYWLIRRDMHSDPAAGNSGIRAFFLNFAEMISLSTAAGLGTFVIAGLGQQYSGGASFGAAYVITVLGVWALLEWERQRSPASSGAAIIFQRLHLYGTQLILLFILTTNWLGTVGLLVDDLFFGGRGAGTQVCGGFTVCQGPNLLSAIVSTVWIILFWLGYSFLSRRDMTSLLRKVLHLFSFGYGVVAVLVGIYRGVELILLAVLKVAVEQRNISGPFAEYDVLSPLTLGLLVVGCYVFWLRQAAQQEASERVSVPLTIQAIAAALLGLSFWWGCGGILLNILEYIVPSNTPLNAEDWAMAIALIVTGIGYIPLDILLRRNSARAALMAPLRGFVLALFGGGILTGAIGGATALYAYGTALLGSPFDNWIYMAHAGLSAFVVGVAIVGIYLWTSISQHFFSGTVKQEATSSAQTSTPTTSTAPISPGTKPQVAEEKAPLVLPTMRTASPIEEILDELLAGKISRDEAIARIESLVHQGV